MIFSTPCDLQQICLQNTQVMLGILMRVKLQPSEIKNSLITVQGSESDVNMHRFKTYSDALEMIRKLTSYTQFTLIAIQNHFQGIT